jgi:hypothetical protein
VEIANILKTLWRLKLLVILGVVIAAFAGYATTYKATIPPTFESKSIEYGSAATQVLIDSTQSPLVDIAQDISPLSYRAQLYTQLVTSEPAKEAIAKAAGMEPGMIVISSQLPSTGTKSSKEAGSEERSNELLAAGHVKRLLFTASEDLPVIDVLAQAQTGEEATKLSNAGAKGLIDYVASLQAKSKVAKINQVSLRQLGPARGGLVNEGASKQMAFMAFIGVLVVWCILLVLLSNLIDALRQSSSRSELDEADALELDGWIFSGPRAAEDDEAPAVRRPGADAA